jgi:hypothetical protein
MPRTPAQGAAARRVLALLRVDPDEVDRTLTLVGMSFGAAAIQVLGRTVRDTLFLSRYDPTLLPWMFVLYGGVSALVAVVFTRAAARFRLDRLLFGSLALGAATYVAAYGLILADAPEIYPAFYVWADVVAGLLTMQVWAVAGSLHTARDAKRLFGVIGAGGVLGTIAFGVTAGALVRAVGTPALLLVAAALMGAVGWLADRARRFPAATSSVRHDPGYEREARMPRVYLGVLGALLVVTFTVAQVADYQFKLIARDCFGEMELAQYFALFYAGVGTFSLAFHLFATPRILEQAGVLAGLLCMPVLLGMGSLAVLFVPSIWSATLLKFGDAGFQFTINHASLQLLYLPFPPGTKARLLALLDGALRPLGYAAGGAVLIALAPHLSLPILSLVSLPLIAFWIALAAAARRHYVRALAATLAARPFLAFDEPDLSLDRAAVELLERTIEAGDAERARFAAERLLALPPANPGDLVGKLLRRSDPALRILALRAVTEHRLADLGAAARERLTSDPVPEVRAAAAEAVAAVSVEPVASLGPYLADPHRAIRAAAIAGLLRHGSPECVLAAGPALEALATSRDAGSRAVAARVLERAGNPRFHRRLDVLLVDADKHVRRAACGAARVLRAPELLRPLLAAARLAGSRAAAAYALGAYGDAAVPGIDACLADPDVDPEARCHLAKALRQVGTEAALAVLLRRLEVESDPRARDALWKSVARVVRGGRTVPSWCDLRGLLQRELAPLYRLAQGFEAAAPFRTPLLDGVAQARVQLARTRVLRALEARYRDSSIWLARKRIDAREPAARANAYEILANRLDREDRRLVLPYFEPISARERLLRVAKPLHLEPVGGAEFLAELAVRGDDWLRVCALHAAAEHRLAALREAAREAAAHPATLVRSAGALALARIEDRPLGEREVAMQTTLEKLVLLKGVSLFAEVPGEDLAALVQATEEISPTPEEPVIREGEPGDALYVVVRGTVRVERGGRVLARLGAGECFGELSVIDQEPRSATVIPEADTRLLAIAQEDFYELLADHPEMAASVLRVMSRRLRAASREAS